MSCLINSAAMALGYIHPLKLVFSRYMFRSRIAGTHICDILSYNLLKINAF